MAIIADKAQKRREIAASRRKLFVNNSMKELTVSVITKTANVGKVTVYDYFENKEDINISLVNLSRRRKRRNSAASYETYKMVFCACRDAIYIKHNNKL